MIERSTATALRLSATNPPGAWASQWQASLEAR
jgi:hypothetical protein